MTRLRHLWLAELVSPLGDAMAMTALVLYVIDRGDPATAVAALFLAESLPPLAGPLLGALADRRDRRSVLVVTALLQAAVVLAVAPLPRYGVILALVFARGFLATVFQAAAGGAVPDLVDDEQLPAANARISAAREAGSLAGPPLAGLLYAAFGAEWVLVIDAFTFVVAAALLMGLPALSVVREEPSTFMADVRQGVGAVFGDRFVRTLAVGFWALVLASAGDDVAIPFLGRDELDAGPVGIGFMLGGASLGLLIGFAVVGRGRLPSTPATVVAGMAMVGLGNLLTGLAPAVAVAVVTQAVRGAGIAVFEPALRTLVQRRLRGPTLGRAMANVYAGVGTAAAGGYAVTGPLLDATSARTLFLLIGSASLAVTGLVAVGLRPDVR